MKITLPDDVKQIIETLEQHGYEGYAVGGCVRDSILGRIPNDWDITTSATPQQVKKLFPRTVDTGIQHGTVTVLMGKEGYEVTTYRVDGEYEDARHPKEVTFTANLEEDLRRRDFTINAMAYNDSEGLVDVFGGRADIEQKVIRCVGNAEERFGEDALRIMRAVRFSAQLGFTVDPDTAEAAKKLAGTLSKISAERIQTELVKLLVSPHPDYLRYAWEYGITAVVLPEFDRTMETPQNNPHHCYNVGEHTLEALRNIEADKTLRLAALFHDFGKPQTHTTDADGIDHFHGHAKISAELANNIMHRLKFDNDTLNKVKVYVRYHDLRPELTEKSVRRAVSKVGADAFAEVLKLKMADTLATWADVTPAADEAEVRRMMSCMEPEVWDSLMELNGYETEIRALVALIRGRGDCLSLKELAVKGQDLIAAGVKPGKEMGEILAKLLELVLEEPQRNEREWLIGKSRELRNTEG